MRNLLKKGRRKKDTKLIKMRSDVWLAEVVGGEEGRGALDEGGQKVQTSLIMRPVSTSAAMHAA